MPPPAAAPTPQTGDTRRVLRLCQQALALADVHTVSLQHEPHAPFTPLLLSSQHLRLAQAYGDEGCTPQALSHATSALEALPDPRTAAGRTSLASDDVVGLLTDVRLTLAELLLHSDPPRPAEALRHLDLVPSASDSIDGYGREGDDFDDGSAAGDQQQRRRNGGGSGEPSAHQELVMAALRAQAHGFLGEAALAAARSHRAAKEDQQQQIRKLSAMQRDKLKGSYTASMLEGAVRDAEAAVRREDAQEEEACAAAEAELDAGIDSLMSVITVQEQRAKDVGDESPALRDALSDQCVNLRRRGAQLMYSLSQVRRLQGDYAAQLQLLQEILMNQDYYGEGAGGEQAEALLALQKEKGALLVAAGRYEEALQTYQQLLRSPPLPPPGVARRPASRTRSSAGGSSAASQRQAADLHASEMHKLIGSVHVAMGQYDAAEQAYRLAAQLFMTGAEVSAAHPEVAELQQRIADLRLAARAAQLKQQAASAAAGRHYHEALVAYKEALDLLQTYSGRDGGSQWATLQQAELIKLMGDVHAHGLGNPGRAYRAYSSAAYLYEQQLGARQALTAECRRCIEELPQQAVAAERATAEYYDLSYGKFWMSEVDAAGSGGTAAGALTGTGTTRAMAPSASPSARPSRQY